VYFSPQTSPAMYPSREVSETNQPLLQILLWKCQICTVGIPFSHKMSQWTPQRKKSQNLQKPKITHVQKLWIYKNQEEAEIVLTKCTTVHKKKAYEIGHTLDVVEFGLHGAESVQPFESSLFVSEPFLQLATASVTCALRLSVATPLAYTRSFLVTSSWYIVPPVRLDTHWLEYRWCCYDVVWHILR